MRKLKIWYIDGTDEVVEGARRTEVKEGVLRVYDQLEYIEDNNYNSYPTRKHLGSYPLTALKKWHWVDVDE